MSSSTKSKKRYQEEKIQGMISQFDSNYARLLALGESSPSPLQFDLNASLYVKPDLNASLVIKSEMNCFIKGGTESVSLYNPVRYSSVCYHIRTSLQRLSIDDQVRCNIFKYTTNSNGVCSFIWDNGDSHNDSLIIRPPERLDQKWIRAPHSIPGLLQVYVLLHRTQTIHKCFVQDLVNIVGCRGGKDASGTRLKIQHDSFQQFYYWHDDPEVEKVKLKNIPAGTSYQKNSFSPLRSADILDCFGEAFSVESEEEMKKRNEGAAVQEEKTLMKGLEQADETGAVREEKTDTGLEQPDEEKVSAEKRSVPTSTAIVDSPVTTTTSTDEEDQMEDVATVKTRRFKKASTSNTNKPKKLPETSKPAQQSIAAKESKTSKKRTTSRKPPKRPVSDTDSESDASPKHNVRKRTKKDTVVMTVVEEKGPFLLSHPRYHTRFVKSASYSLPLLIQLECDQHQAFPQKFTLTAVLWYADEYQPEATHEENKTDPLGEAYHYRVNMDGKVLYASESERTCFFHQIVHVEPPGHPASQLVNQFFSSFNAVPKLLFMNVSGWDAWKVCGTPWETMRSVVFKEAKRRYFNNNSLLQSDNPAEYEGTPDIKTLLCRDLLANLCRHECDSTRCSPPEFGTREELRAESTRSNNVPLPKPAVHRCPHGISTHSQAFVPGEETATEAKKLKMLKERQLRPFGRRITFEDWQLSDDNIVQNKLRRPFWTDPLFDRLTTLQQRIWPDSYAIEQTFHPIPNSHLLRTGKDLQEFAKYYTLFPLQNVWRPSIQSEHSRVNGRDSTKNGLTSAQPYLSSATDERFSDMQLGTLWKIKLPEYRILDRWMGQ